MLGGSDRAGENRWCSRCILKVSIQGWLIGYRVPEKERSWNWIDLPLTEMGKTESSFGNVGHISKIPKWTCRIGSLIHKFEDLEKCKRDWHINRV